MNPQKQKHLIKKFVSYMQSHENNIRRQISERKYRPSVVGRIGFGPKIQIIAPETQ